MDKYKILVVDDDKEIRNVLIRLLNENYTVIGASSAHDAMLILDKTYSLVILDIMMPEKDGRKNTERSDYVPELCEHTAQRFLPGFR